ncbi:MAG: hypothetical protein A3I68_04875 [Candidatus Melainabacteria bacterium RIFCSPLOWO2_02_FULL_35_15]|nr:MAG: hypothetical protein A3I68_04875 [Candidatus Melainabacteria bacterium RIFCSPLOWO2_02_FULL_35_15]
MNDFQKNLLLRRKHYRERRNTVRKILFILSLILFFFVLYFILQIPNTGPAAIELSKNHLIKSEYIVQNISKEISGRNFFFISPRKLTKNLLLSCGLLKNAVIRKYLLPRLKLVVIVKEKQLWGKLIANNSGNNPAYITNEGNLINGNYINFNLLPEDLILVFCTNSTYVSEAALLILKDTLDFFNTRLKIKINKFLVTDRNTLEIYTDNFIKINAGYIDSNLLVKIAKLSDILNQIKKKSYLIQYIDLSLENGAVIKKVDEGKVDKKHLRLFMILH